MPNAAARTARGLGMRTRPTNKTQVFNEMSLMENWLIIHVINSCTLLVLSRGISTFHNLEDSSCVQHG